MKTIVVEIPEWAWAALVAEAYEDGETLEQYVANTLIGTAEGNIQVRAGVVDERLEALGLSDAELARFGNYLKAIMGLEPDD